MSTSDPIPLEEIRAAHDRIRPFILRTPVVRLNVTDVPAEIFLKLENLQPIGSFKLRGSGNAMLQASREELQHGVVTASAGNMAQGVAWNARRMGIPCTVVVPDHAPQTKLDAIARLGGKTVQVPFADWWQILLNPIVGRASLPAGTEAGATNVRNGFFIHPVSDRSVIAGNGTIGIEILEDVPDVSAILVPYGGGGLSSGIASAIRALKPAVKVFACEVDTAAPLAPSLAAGSPQQVEYTPSFVDGIGGKSILPEMWPLVSKLLNGSVLVSLNEIAAAIRLLVERNRVVAEGAGAASVAAALSAKAGSGKIVCVVSGGNIDPSKLATILSGHLP